VTRSLAAGARRRIEKDLRIAQARLLPPEREIGWTTREIQVARVNRLTDALDRVREGAYGVCIECDEPLAAARLEALPEVETCVSCQSRIERLDRQVERSRDHGAALLETE
jgi:RNA polymerase-binding transcription factor DksA